MMILGSTLYSNAIKPVGASSIANDHTLVLYDAQTGTVPSAQLMSFTDFPFGEALPTFLEDVTVIDSTRTGNDTYAGWISSAESVSGFPILNRSVGFQLKVTLQVEDESHINNDRAGFSIIILSEDVKGIEIAFWENEIWVQGDSNTGGLFRHGEGIAFATTAGLVDYQITIVGDTYTLMANNENVLTGPVRDYSAFDGFPDPYETPNFIFIGDDTTSAQARVRLSYVSITGTEPVVPGSTSSSPPIPTPFPTTPIPSPTPSPKPFELCPSGLSVMVLIGMLKFINGKPDTWFKNKK